MKIVAIDALDRDYIPDILICENVNEKHGKEIVDFLNTKYGGGLGRWFILANDDRRILTYKDIYGVE